MTEEEKAEKAEKYAKDYFGAYYPQEEERRAVEQAYLDGLHEGQAESNRLAQHILELQKDKGELTDKVKYYEQQLSAMEKGVCDVCKVKDADYYEKQIADLEKENAELRNNGFTVSAMTEQQLKVAIEKGEQLEKKLEQAKDIMGDLLFLVITSHIRTINSEEIKDKARQFIKGAENE